MTAYRTKDARRARIVHGRADEGCPKFRHPKVDGCAMVIFGASGDLARRKLIPALYRLHRDGALDPCFSILGVSRSDISDDEFRRAMRDALEEFDARPEEREWDAFARRLTYLSADLTDDEAYGRLATRLEELGAGDPAAGNHLFYFSVPPDLAPDIVQGLDHAGLTAEGKGRGWTRIVVEKPFGHDLESARELNRRLGEIFREEQVYRIDHYLGKETVQNILAFRFGNTMFEPLWNRNYVDHVEITAAETLGVEDRGGFYDETGALRDMVASHLLQLVTLTAMEPPVAFEPGAVREEKVKVLRSMSPMTPEEVAARTARGQYAKGEIDGDPVLGYRDIDAVADDSTTETYAAVELRVDNWRWEGVPFYVRTGKRLARDLTEIVVHLKPTPHALFARQDGSVSPNTIVIRFKPDEEIDVTFSAKVPGEGMRTSRVRMQFDYSEAFGIELPDAYETLLVDAMRGDQTLFTRNDEVEAQWAVITPILEAWRETPQPGFPNYAAGSDGPPEADAVPARNGHVWRSIVRAAAESTPDRIPAGEST